MGSPIIIIAAPRSGTNMLRDMLCMHETLVTWPCDEINPIWRYGNAAHPSDELTVSMATPRVKRYIRKRFERLARRNPGSQIVEKTCANSLRVPFIAEIFPEARFLFMIRDGRDAIASAMSRWTGSTSLGYVLEKARWVPIRDVPRYAAVFAASRLRRLGSSERALSTWGPRFHGIDQWGAESSLIEVCAEQWRQCVVQAEQGLESIPQANVLRIRYEHLVTRPAEEFGRIFSFLRLPLPEELRAKIVSRVTPSNVGKHSCQLDAEGVAHIERITGSVLSHVLAGIEDGVGS